MILQLNHINVNQLLRNLNCWLFKLRAAQHPLFCLLSCTPAAGSALYALSERCAAHGRGRYATPHIPTAKCTVGYRNVSDMCGFLVVWGLHVNWVVLCLAASSTTKLSQGAAAERLYSIPSLITKWRYICYDWLYSTLGKVTTCLQGRLAAQSPGDLLFLKHLLLIFFPPPFASGCICRTKYRLSFHIHYYFPRHWGWALWCVRFRDLSRHVLSRLADGRSGFRGAKDDWWEMRLYAYWCVCAETFSSCFLATQKRSVLQCFICSLPFFFSSSLLFSPKHRV